MPRKMHLVIDEVGATSVEYALMAGLIAVAIATAVGTLGTTVASLFNTAAVNVGS